ncbi:hypothetical protein HG15A2_17630 [Adhaeretor mobilis]|uniref:Uncharacterized protein n=1 Tax=Adhaeretor mobilis TaxID=1930276 RepID=A0A517MUC2_9BACT|nr:hypothetical protein HG15A2_17630 [Adhaeretor mobilis]
MNIASCLFEFQKLNHRCLTDQTQGIDLTNGYWGQILSSSGRSGRPFFTIQFKAIEVQKTPIPFLFLGFVCLWN